jgi:ABC-type uncharacterized transport system permease subunit
VRERLFSIAIAVVAAALGIVAALAALWWAGYPPAAVAAVWYHAALGTRHGWAQSLQEACPLTMTGLATAVAFRAGALTIGVEGQFRLGSVAFVGCALALSRAPSAVAWAVALAAALAAGAAWAAIAGALERWRAVPLVLSTILLNFVAAALTTWLIEVPLHDPSTTAPQTATLPANLTLPVLLPNTRLHLGVVIAGLVALATWLMQERTVVGYELGMTGANPRAARVAGLRVDSLRFGALLASGALAALGGALEQAGVTHYMSDSSVSYGYAGIAVALLGRLHPLGVAAAAWFFGALDAGARGLERELDIPHDLGEVLKGVVLLSVLVAGGVRALLRTRSAGA